MVTTLSLKKYRLYVYSFNSETIVKSLYRGLDID